MQYEEKIFELLGDSNENALMEWLISLPPLEQVDALTDFKTVMESVLRQKGITNEDESLLALEKKTEEYLEAVLDEQMANLKLDLALAERDKAFAEMHESVAKMREDVKIKITTNAPNAAEMMELAQQIRDYEIAADTYDPSNWDWFEA